MNRRGFLTGLLCAPVIIRTPGLLMPIKPPLRFRGPYNGIFSPEMVANEMLGILAGAITPEQIEAMTRDGGGAMRTTVTEAGFVEVKFIPGSEIYREFYG